MAEDYPGLGPPIGETNLPPAAAPIQYPGLGAPVSEAGTEEKPKPQPEMPSFGTALAQGVGAGFRHAGEGIQVMRGQEPAAPQQESPAAAPFELSDIASPLAKGLPKLAYGLGESAPTLAGGITGGIAGAMTPLPGGALIGGAAGAGVGAALQSVGPFFADELKKSPKDPDGAWTRAMQRAATSGAFSALGWGMFPAKLAEGPLKQMAFQALGIQPAIAAGEQATQNVLQGKPTTEGLGAAYARGAVGTAIPMAGHAILSGAFREAQSVAQRRASDPILARLGEPSEPNKGTLSQRFNNFYTDIKDDLNPFRQADKILAEGRQLSPEESSYIAARLTRGSTGKAEHFVDYGTFDPVTGARMGPGLREVLKPVEGDMDGFRRYALARRAIEKDNENVDTGIPIPEAHAAVAAGNAKFARTFNSAWLKYHYDLLEYMVKSGIVSRRDAAAMRAKIRNYVPFHRVMEEAGISAGGAGRGLQAWDPIHSMGESQLPIIDPIETTIRNTYTFISLADRNRALQKLQTLTSASSRGDEVLTKVRPPVRPISVTAEEVERALRRQGVSASPDPEGFTVFRPNSFRPAPDEIRIFNDGKPTTYKVDPRLAGAVSGMDKETINTLTRFLAHPARLLRAGATLSPEFILRNPVRDQFSAFVFSTFGRGYVPIVDLIKGAGQAFTRGEGFQGWLRDGGANSAMVSIDRNYVENLVRQMKDPSLMGTARNVLKSPIEILRAASELMENATRVGEYMRLKERGLSREAAGYGSREITLDFQRIGARMRGVNQVIAFFNAQMEGVDRAGRALYANPQRFIPAVAASITLPSLYLAWANRDDPRVKEIARWEKDIFWIVPTDNWQPVSAQDAAKAPKGYARQKEDGSWELNKGNIYRIPKPFELGVMFGSLPERVFDAWWNKNPDAFKNIGKSLGSAFAPGYVPQAISPIIEQFANRSLFLDRPLVPQYLQGLLPQYRSNPYTSDTAKAIGSFIDKLPGMKDSDLSSPIIVENYIRAWTGGLGKHVLDLSDAVLRGAGVAPTKIEPTLTNADKIGWKAFSVRFPEAGANSIQDFYEEYNKRTQIKKTATFLTKTGEPEEGQDLLRQNVLATAEGIHKALGAQMKLVRDTYRNPKMSPDEKRQFIDMSYLQMIKIAQTGNQVFKRTEDAFKAKQGQ